MAIDDEAEQLLRRLLAEAPTSIQWPALYLLAIHAHQRSQDISGSILTTHLIEQGFPQLAAERFGAEFDRYLALLAMYDRLRQA
jgi:hypothetical protein